MRLQKFCGCCSLQGGAIIIGSLSLVCSVLSAISAGPRIMDEIECRVDDVGSQCLMRMFMTGVLTYVIVVGIMAALMIQGALKRKPDLMFPWLAISTTDLLVKSSLSFGFLVYAPKILHVDWYFILLGLIFVGLGLHVYIWLVVFSFYKVLTIEKYSDAAPPTEGKVYNQSPMNIYHNV